jgi:hypothetical protein
MSFNKINNPDYQRRVIEEAFDPNKMLLVCKTHMYTGGGPIPVKGEDCPKCHKAFWYTYACNLPPDKRTEMIDTLHETVAKLCEEVDAGRFDIKLFPHAKIESIEKA